MSQTIIKTRVIPKKITENIVSRQRLLMKFEENAAKNMILVLGPAGYGKTTSVLDFLAESGRKYAWLYISNDIDSAASFLSYLIHALKVLNPGFGDETLELINSFVQSDLFNRDETNTINAAVGALINEFVESFPEEVYLVADDLHNIEDLNWVNSVFNALIESFPANLHMIITSRSTPVFNISRLKAKRKLAVIESDDLNFTGDETERLLDEIYSIKCKKEDVNLLIDKFEGWITGLHLVLQTYGIEFNRLTAEKQEMGGDLFSYFAEDIFAQLDERTKNFLVSTSMLDSFTQELCSTVLKLEGSSTIPGELKRKNLFIESAEHVDEKGKTETSYSYHSLFRQFLYAKLLEVKSPAEIKELAEKVFDHYLLKGDKLQAIEFSLRSEHFDRAAALILENYELLFQSAGYETLRRWLAQIPESEIAANPELKFIKGRLLNFFKTDTEGAYEIFTELIRTSEVNSPLYVKANLEAAEIQRLTGRPDEALAILKELYSIETEPELRIRIIISLAKCYYRLGSKYYDNILKLAAEAEKLADENKTEHLLFDIYSLYGRIYLNKGEFVKSLHYFESSYRRESNLFRKFQTVSDIILLQSWSGSYERAKEYYDEAEALYKKIRISFLERDLLRLNALLRFEAGDYEGAIDGFSKLSSMDVKNKFTSFLPTYNLILSECSMLLGEYSKSSEYIELAVKFKDPKDEYLQTELEYHKALLEKAVSPSAKTEKVLLNTLKHYEQFSSLYNKTQVQLHLADLYYKKGEQLVSQQYLSECFASAREKKYHSFLLQHFRPMRYLFDTAIAAGIEKDFVDHLKNNVVKRNSLNWLSEECRSRLAKENASLVDICLKAFGGAEISVRGTAIPEESWLRKKSKLLLVYLLINQGIRIQKDKVLGIFFAELSPESADNIFHQAITNIRNVLKPSVNAKQNEEAKAKRSKKSAGADNTVSYIVYEDKILHMTPGFEYYVDVLEFNRLAALVKSPETDESAKSAYARQAISIYRGEFLPGYYDEWIEELRSILEHKYIETCEELITILEKKKQFEELIEYSEKLLQADKLHEEAFYMLIHGYAAIGNITMAKKKLSQLIKTYDEEYGEKPPKALMSKIMNIEGLQ